MRYAQGGHDAVGADRSGDGGQGANEGGGDAGPFQLLDYRCPATSAGSSGGGEDHPHLVGELGADVLGDFPPEACGVINGGGVAGGGVEELH
jgi:hypothetical protein